jgi:hypothetical protein
VPQTFKVDQAATFTKVILLEIEPKTAYGSDQQERNREGVLRWSAQVVAGFRAFDRSSNEVLKVGFDADGDPRTSIEPYTPIELVDFEIGFMAKERKNKETGASEMTGVSVWCRCREIRPISATGSGRRSHLASAEATG